MYVQQQSAFSRPMCVCAWDGVRLGAPGWVAPARPFGPATRACSRSHVTSTPVTSCNALVCCLAPPPSQPLCPLDCRRAPQIAVCGGVCAHPTCGGGREDICMRGVSSLLSCCLCVRAVCVHCRRASHSQRLAREQAGGDAWHAKGAPRHLLVASQCMW